MTLELDITDSNGQIVTSPGPFDPDGDPVTFSIETLTKTGSVDPIVTIGSDGILHIEADVNLAGSLVKITISASDGSETTPFGSIDPISIFFS